MGACSNVQDPVDSKFPALVTEVSGPYEDGGVATRIVDSSFDATTGNLLSRTISGDESTYSGGAFSLLMSYSGYNGAGQPGTIDPPGYGTGDQTSFTYNVSGANGLLPDTRTDPIDPDVHTTSFEYDSFNRRTATVDPNGHRVETSYDALGRTTAVTVEPETGSGLPGLVTSYTYTPLGDLFCAKLPRGNATQTSYDAAGRLIEVARGTAVASPTSTSCLSITSATPAEKTTYTLDNFGHRIEERLFRSTGSGWLATPDATTDFNYSTRCHLDAMVRAPGKPEQSTTSFQYDCAGNLSQMTEAAGSPVASTTSYGYDAVNRLTSTTQAWGGSGGGTVSTLYGYDVQDHLTSVTDGQGNETSYTYSDRDLMTAEVSPVSGSSSFAYNDHGELIQSTDGRGLTTSRTVDAADRVTLINYPGTDPDATFAYSRQVGDIGNPTTQVGHLFEMSRGDATTDYGYDAYWRLDDDGGLAMTLDANGLPSTISYPQGIEIRTTYDASDRPSRLEISENGGASWSNVVTTVTYKALGPLSGLTFGNGRTETRAYDTRYLPSSLVTSSSLLTWTYTHGAAGDVTQISQTFPTSVTRSFGYQPDQRYLTSASGPWPGPLTWTYDKIGNRLTEVRGGGGGYSDSYLYATNGSGGNTAILDHVNRGGGLLRTYAFDNGFLDTVTASANTVDFTYDAAGVQTKTYRPASGDELDYEYDARGFLASAHTPEMAPTPHCTGGNGVFCDDYETGDFACWSAVTGGAPGGVCPWNATSDSVTATYSSAGKLFGLDRIVSGNLERKAVLYLGDRPVAIWSKSGTSASILTYLTTDHLGTPVLAMNAAGNAIWRGGFEPFGADFTVPSAQTSGIFLRLPGQWWDELFDSSTLGAQQFQNLFRWYSPELGRFLSSDPAKRTGAASDLLVAYSLNRPLRLSDPSGAIVGGVDPSIRRFLACALKDPGFKTFWTWMDEDSNVWNVSRSACPRSGIDSSCWTRPGFFGLDPGEVHLAPASGSCRDVVEDLIHEVAEAYANQHLGLSTNALLHPEVPRDPQPGETYASPAHNFAAVADNAAASACCGCGND